ncbi:MAG: hypothetical protein U5K00_12990 [Melioribacteraceae bacterium]|nr:hypothetical protein [Melioribacteraceae bacterium]
MGETVPFEKSITLRAFLPDVTGSFRLIKNGELVFTTENVDFEYVVEEKGAYRIEVFFEGKAWIFSNHIRIGI